MFMISGFINAECAGIATLTCVLALSPKAHGPNNVPLPDSLYQPA
jgi:hypothetical protein